MSDTSTPTTPTLLCVDPGKTTGLAWCSLIWATHDMKIDERFSQQCSYGQIEGGVNEQTQMIARGIRDLDVRLVVMEDSSHFLLKGGKSLRKDSLIPVHLGACVDYACHVMRQVHGIPVSFMYQTPAQAKGVMTDARMQALGLKLPNAERHAMDALRHLILMLRRLKQDRSLLEGVKTL